MDERNIIELKNKCLQTINDLKEEIKQNEMLAKCCDDTTISLVNPSIIKQIQYDSRSAENAAENPDVARDGDKERAEKGIQDSNIKLLESKKNLEQVIENLGFVTSPNLVADVDNLKSFIVKNKEKDEAWLEYSQDILNGNYHEFVEKVEEPVIEEEKEEEIQEEVVENNQEEVQEEEVIEEEQPVVEETKEEPVISVEPFNPEQDFSNYDSSELDAQLDSAIQLVSNDVEDLKDSVVLEDEKEPEITSTVENFEDTPIDNEVEITPVEEPVVSDLDNITEPADIFSFDEETKVESVEPVSVDTFESGMNVDEEPVKVESVEEVGAPEETFEDQYTLGLTA